MDEQQKERLEQELKFLEESLEAEVISKDEFERGKERIERKIRELEEVPEEETPTEEIKEEPREAETPEPQTEEQPKEEAPQEEVQEQQEPQIEIKEIKEQPTKIIGAEETTEPQEKAPDTQIEKTEEKEKKPIGQQIPEETEKKPEDTQKPQQEGKQEEQKEESIEPQEESISKWVYGIMIIILALILFFYIRGCDNTEDMPSEETLLEEITPVCSSDSDCEQEGAFGTCSNPDTKESVCEFQKDVETNLLVINDKNCKSCDSTTTKTIVKAIFPNIDIKEIDFSTKEAKNLTEKLKIDALPAYIFDSNIKDAINFVNFNSALSQRGDNYVMTNTASGAIYYFRRPMIKNKMDIYLLPDSSQQLEPHLKEVSDLFNGKITFDKHLVTERQKKVLEEEMDINTYPTFLLNNQVKFRGILPANLIKEKICEVNTFEECKEELSRI